MDWFTSDLHIGHDKDFLWGPRGFSNVTEMDTAIIKNWNSVVAPEDTVYILGDMYLGTNCVEHSRVFRNLNGKIGFICGNHDTETKIYRCVMEFGFSCYGYGMPYKHSKNWRFFCSHYPTLTGNYDDNKRRPVINLCGHTHTKDKFADWNKGSIYHVELDAHNMYPVSIEQIIKDIEKENFK